MTKINSSDVIMFVFAGIVLIGLLFGFIIYFLMSYRLKQKDYALLQKQKQEIDLQKEVVQKTLEELRATQRQLIQSEKMASLGELTAGIAHEIQNPLNFVNNFSELTAELLNELGDDSIQKLPEIEKDKAKNILQDAVANLEKIIHHGRRADAIVKGMLQHSHHSSGQKQMTDLNELTAEYIRLSYHGQRARDKTLVVNIKTAFDPGLRKLNVIPGEIGRVIVNLLNNALFSVMEKKKMHREGFEPMVWVNTSQSADRVEIIVRDNGMGIRPNLIEKIYQPFFTTKPSGQGTGLGLSLSYELITKGYGGEIKVDTVEGEYAQFTISLPDQ